VSKPTGIKLTAKKRSPMYSISIADFADTIEGMKAISGPRGGLGDWRPELRAWLREAGAQVEDNFRQGASSQPWGEISDIAFRRRIFSILSKRPTLTDVGVPRKVPVGGIPGPMYRRRKDGTVYYANIRIRQSEMVWRGLKGAASNVVEGKFSDVSLISVGKTTARFGVKGGPQEIKYAAPLQKKYKFMYIPAATRAYLRELVEQGVEQRLMGMYDYTGRSQAGRTYAEEISARFTP
jgi:hypothetical protein